ncbi:MAG: YlxF [Paenibacillus sp.]|jgi:flagellar motility protein MotE (MotC chaperone)|nr:YlxF [Paenibacillus sp.]
MAANTDTEKSSYGAFERFLFFVTPIIFTLVLLGVLFALFNSSMLNSVLKAANQVPFLEKLIPDPAAKDKVTLPAAPQDSAATENNDAAVIEQLRAQLNQARAELQTSTNQNQQKDQSIKALQTQVTDLDNKLKAKTQTDEEYKAQIQQLASIYAGMMPSKSAPILEALTLKERALVLNEMKPADRGKVLERMTPTVAAETSIQLKDIVPAKDMQLQALQERLDVNKEQQQKAATISKEDIGQTFSQMVPKSAASILIEINAASPTKAVDILKAMDNAGRAKVLAAITDANKQVAASLSSRITE